MRKPLSQGVEVGSQNMPREKALRRRGPCPPHSAAQRRAGRRSEPAWGAGPGRRPGGSERVTLAVGKPGRRGTFWQECRGFTVLSQDPTALLPAGQPRT